MKRFLGSLSFILVASFFASAFEGVVTVEFFSEEMTNSGKVYIKDMKMKLILQNQLGGTNGYPIIDFSSQKAIFVFIDNKYYMTLPLDSIIKNLEEDPLTLIESSDVSEVLGYKAKRFYQILKDKNLTVDAWATDEEKLNLNPFVGVQRLGDEGIIVSKAAHFLYKKGFTPLKIVVISISLGSLVYNSYTIECYFFTHLSDRYYEKVFNDNSHASFGYGVTFDQKMMTLDV
jgi:hypothetical protein